jgi:hypothetical protein
MTPRPRKKSENVPIVLSLGLSVQLPGRRQRRPSDRASGTSKEGQLPAFAGPWSAGPELRQARVAVSEAATLAQTKFLVTNDAGPGRHGAQAVAGRQRSSNTVRSPISPPTQNEYNGSRRSKSS